MCHRCTFPRRAVDWSIGGKRSRWGSLFELYWGARLHEGIFDNQNFPVVTVQEGNEALNASLVIAVKGTLGKRLYSQSRISATASSHIACKLTFQMTGLRFQQLVYCSRILILSFAIVVGVSTALVERFPLSGVSLLVFHVLFILEINERHCAAVGRYEDLTFEFGLHCSLIATGCVKRPEIRRPWCTGFFDERKKERNITAPWDMS